MLGILKRVIGFATYRKLTKISGFYIHTETKFFLYSKDYKVISILRQVVYSADSCFFNHYSLKQGFLAQMWFSESIDSKLYVFGLAKSVFLFARKTPRFFFERGDLILVAKH